MSKTGEKLNKSDIDKFIADSDLGKKLGLSVRDVDGLTDMFVAQIKDGTARFGEVDIWGFGEFSTTAVKARDAYVGRNPRTGEPVNVPAKPAKNKAKFKAWSGFKKQVESYPAR